MEASVAEVREADGVDSVADTVAAAAVVLPHCEYSYQDTGDCILKLTISFCLIVVVLVAVLRTQPSYTRAP